MVCHQNIAPLDSKTPRLEVLLKSELECDILAITEHWLSESNLKCVQIHGYKLASQYCRTQIIHGGSCLFVKEKVKCVDNTNLTSLSVERYCEISAIDLLDFNMTIILILI